MREGERGIGLKGVKGGIVLNKEKELFKRGGVLFVYVDAVYFSNAKE